MTESSRLLPREEAYTIPVPSATPALYSPPVTDDVILQKPTESPEPEVGEKYVAFTMRLVAQRQTTLQPRGELGSGPAVTAV